MSTTKAISANRVKNNGGTCANAGNITGNGPITKSVAISAPNGLHGITVIAPTSYSGTDTAVDSGIFANPMVGGKLITIGNIDTLAGLAGNSVSLLGADSNRKSIHSKITRRTTHITSWNYATGVATTGANTTDSFGADTAASPTRAIPGYLVILENGQAPSVKAYSQET